MTRRTLYAAGTILLLLAFFLSYRAWRESPTSSTKEAATSQVSAKETTALDSLETKDFSSLQRDVLAILKQEYAKKPAATTTPSSPTPKVLKSRGVQILLAGCLMKQNLPSSIQKLAIGASLE